MNNTATAAFGKTMFNVPQEVFAQYNAWWRERTAMILQNETYKALYLQRYYFRNLLQTKRYDYKQ